MKKEYITPTIKMMPFQIKDIITSAPSGADMGDGDGTKDDGTIE